MRKRGMGEGMLKLVLADDEPVIVRGIKKLVDWEKLGILIVGEYENGGSAMEGILGLKPDIALLDISMPGMDGIEILKNIRRLNLSTKVIFISGFQDFEYAKSAVTYGAVDYLLKPVILEELLHAIEKAAELANGGSVSVYREEKRQQMVVLEETTYLPVLAEIVFDGTENEQMKRLIYFSFHSFLEEYLAEKQLGILFSKDNHTVMIFKGIPLDRVRKALLDLQERTSDIMEKRTAFFIGGLVDSMSQIPQEYERCLDMRRYLFFLDQIKIPILCAGVIERIG